MPQPPNTAQSKYRIGTALGHQNLSALLSEWEQAGIEPRHIIWCGDMPVESTKSGLISAAEREVHLISKFTVVGIQKTNYSGPKKVR